MPQFKAAHVQTLLSLALAKSEGELNRQGFEKLSKNLDSDPKVKFTISQKYIDERIHNQLLKNRQDEKPFINVKREFLDELAVFIQCHSYADFENGLKKFHGFIHFEKLKTNSRRLDLINLVCNKSDAGFIDSRFQQILYPNQADPFQLIFTEIVADKSKEEFTQSLGKGAFTIIFLNSSLHSNYPEFPQTLMELQQEVDIIPIWFDEDSEGDKVFDDLSNWLDVENIDLFIQYFLSLSLESSQNNKQDSKGPGQTTNISDSGAVFLGEVGEIRAEYISARDMHVSINKGKSEDS